jgi:hypothetical protein
MTNLGVALFYGVLLVDDKVLGNAFALQGTMGAPYLARFSRDVGYRGPFLAGLQENPDNHK